jgi:hypothetical protein
MRNNVQRLEYYSKMRNEVHYYPEKPYEKNSAFAINSKGVVASA